MLEEVGELFGFLRGKWDTLAGYLSGGEAQQLAIARALMSKPRLLMMDEPSLGLAPVLVNLVFDLISKLREQGRTLLVVEQNAARMLEVADRAYVLRSGSVVAQGSGTGVLAQTDLFDTFVRGARHDRTHPEHHRRGWGGEASTRCWHWAWPWSSASCTC